MKDNSKLIKNVILNLFQDLRSRNKFGMTIKRFVMTRTSGFTLIELLIVIVIIGILSTFLMANFIGIRQRARDGQRKSDLRQLQSALEMYRTDQGNYPSSLTSCDPPSAFTENSVTYMQKIPCDPLDKTTSYTYSPADSNTNYSIVACLENGNDSEIDKDGSDDPIPCADPTRWQFTLRNP